SDYEMPGRNGIEFLETVRETHPELPFILYTGKGSEEVASDAISAGVTDYIQKEGGTDQYAILANKIANAVEGYWSASVARQRQHRLEQILKILPSCVVQIDYDGQFVYANDRAREVLGLDPAAVPGRTYNDPEWDIKDLQGDPIPDEELPFRQVRDSGEPVYGYRHSIEWPDGTRKLLRVSGAPLLTDDGHVKSTVFSLTDITDEREREMALERLEEIVLSMNDVAVVARDEIIEYCTPHISALIGFEPEDIIGEAFGELVAEEYRELVVERHKARLRGDDDADPPASCPIELRSADGDTVPVELDVTRITYGGRPATLTIIRSAER
ncbi:MAG: PAS domain S-box protein, partial [Halobacteriales archaeon]